MKLIDLSNEERIEVLDAMWKRLQPKLSKVNQRLNTLERRRHVLAHRLELVAMAYKSAVKRDQ